ncbi:MAG TPA: divalent-cation tolerance protein CutA [Thermoanaerobaculia bacterium]|nr:divalent-cation tolerance protein CutA [Thermoanaerobaculia bacterium]
MKRLRRVEPAPAEQALEPQPLPLAVRLTPHQGWSSLLPAMGAIVVVTTVGTEDQANTIARELVARRLAASVNILPVVRSVYRWKGKVCEDGELMLTIKTLDSEYDEVAETIRELHSYELPEILAFAVTRGEPGFLSWIADGVDKTNPANDDEDEDEDESLEDD